MNIPAKIAKCVWLVLGAWWVTALVLSVAACRCYAIDILTVPTANQLKSGEVDLSAYYLNLDFPPNAPQLARFQALSVGFTPSLELDVQRYDIDKDETSVILLGNIKLLSETRTLPDVVIGARNFTGEATTRNPAFRDLSSKPSYYLCTAKTLPLDPEVLGPPFLRFHLSVGTEDWTLLGDKRHDGLFGGVQYRSRQGIGAVVLYDGETWITGIGFPIGKSGLALRGGTAGTNQWYGGLSYRVQLGK